MSTQFYTDPQAPQQQAPYPQAPQQQAPYQQAPYQQVPYQQVHYHQAPSQQPSGPSWFRIWAVVLGTALTAAIVVLCVALFHGHSGTAPATGPSTSTSVPAHPGIPVTPVVPAHPTTPPTGSAG